MKRSELMRARWFAAVVSVGVCFAVGCAAGDDDGGGTTDDHLTGASGTSDVPLRALVACEDPLHTIAELSVAEAEGGSRIALKITSADTFFAIEYRGSDVGAVRELSAGRSASVPAQLLSELGRRDTIRVEVEGNATSLILSSAQHKDRVFACRRGPAPSAKPVTAPQSPPPAPTSADPLGLLLRCQDAATNTTADLSIPKGPDGSLISLKVRPFDDFTTIEYRGSDVSAVAALGSGRPVSVPAELLGDFGRRDLLHVDGETLKLESAQHGERTFRCSPAR